MNQIISFDKEYAFLSNFYPCTVNAYKSAEAAYQAVLMGRRGLGIELKDSYFAQATKNLESAESTADTEGVDTRVRLRCPNCGVKVTDGKICPICGVDLMAKEE